MEAQEKRLGFKENNAIIYGPVLSRRFGHSLGIDIIPFKVCPYDCVYCQLGKTTIKTLERKKYADIDFQDFKKQVKKNINSHPDIKYISFSGSGEPTLNILISRYISEIKEITDIPVLVLTGGATLSSQGVIDDICNADLIKVSLDAPSSILLKKINRPAPGVEFEKNIEGLKKLSDKFKGKIWLEVMILNKINDSAACGHMFKDIIETLEGRIEKIHLNTAVRFPAEDGLSLPDIDNIKKIKEILGEKAEIIDKASGTEYRGDIINLEKKVLQLLKRRPSTAKDIGLSLGLNINEIIKVCRWLEDKGRISSLNNKYIILRSNNL